MKITLFISFCLAILTSFSQEVTLEVAGNREVEPAYRITKQPNLIDTVIPYSEIQFPLLSLRHESAFALEAIKTAKIKLVDKLPDLYNSYVKLGIGSKFMPLAEAYFDSKSSRKYLYGIHLKHLSSFGNIKGYAPAQFDRTKISTYGKLNENKYSLEGGLNFNSLGLHHYGLRTETTPKDSIQQRFTDFGAFATYSKHKKDSLSFNYLGTVKYNYFQDKKPNIDSIANNFAREQFVELNGTAWYKWKKEIISADLSAKLNNYKYGIPGDSISPIDSGYVNTNVLVSLAPNITTYAKNNRLKIKFGAIAALNVVNDNIQPKAKVFIYPDIELKFSLFDDILIPYLEINGGLKQNTFKSLSRENEFLLSQVNLLNENVIVNGKLGFKGTLSSKVMFNASASFGLHQDKALFISDTLFSNENRFKVVYDDMSITTIQASIIYQMNEKLKIEGIGTFYSYQTKHYIFAWNLPQIQFVSRAKYFVLENLSVSLDLNIEGGRNTLVYSKSESDLEENQQFSKKLGIVADFNLGAEYKYNERLSAFLQFNNFVAQRYNRWYNYPVQGFQVMGGVSFRF
jgi:hypothetical protein